MNDIEKTTVSKLIGIYCHSKHGTKKILCADCIEMETYAHQRLDKCVFGEDKPNCDKCTIHCYKPEMRLRIKTIMRYAGPRVVLHHPLLAIKHIVGRYTKQKNRG